MGAATGSRLNTTRPLVFITHHLESISFANSTTLSGSNPNFLWSSLSGADAPNVSIPIIRPDEPTYRSIADKTSAGNYRKSFCYYNEQSLLVSMFFYATTAALFLGVFIVRFKLELMLSIPLVAGAFAF